MAVHGVVHALRRRVRLVAPDIEVRLARYLLGLVAARNPLLTGGIVEVELAISQGELALLLGASRPKVNAALVTLEDQGAIERDGTKLTCHIDGLIAVASLD